MPRTSALTISCTRPPRLTIISLRYGHLAILFRLSLPRYGHVAIDLISIELKLFFRIVEVAKEAAAKCIQTEAIYGTKFLVEPIAPATLAVPSDCFHFLSFSCPFIKMIFVYY